MHGSQEQANLRNRARQLANRALGDQLDVLILFGSRARGDASPDSDWDVLAMLRDDADPSHARRLLCGITGDLAEETGEQVNFKAIRWCDAPEASTLLRNIAMDGERL